MLEIKTRRCYIKGLEDTMKNCNCDFITKDSDSASNGLEYVVHTSFPRSEQLTHSETGNFLEGPKIYLSC